MKIRGPSNLLLFFSIDEQTGYWTAVKRRQFFKKLGGGWLGRVPEVIKSEQDTNKQDQKKKKKLVWLAIVFPNMLVAI